MNVGCRFAYDLETAPSHRHGDWERYSRLSKIKQRCSGRFHSAQIHPRTVGTWPNPAEEVGLNSPPTGLFLYMFQLTSSLSYAVLTRRH